MKPRVILRTVLLVLGPERWAMRWRRNPLEPAMRRAGTNLGARVLGALLVAAVLLACPLRAWAVPALVNNSTVARVAFTTASTNVTITSTTAGNLLIFATAVLERDACGHLLTRQIWIAANRLSGIPARNAEQVSDVERPRGAHVHGHVQRRKDPLGRPADAIQVIGDRLLLRWGEARDDNAARHRVQPRAAA